MMRQLASTTALLLLLTACSNNYNIDTKGVGMNDSLSVPTPPAGSSSPQVAVPSLSALANPPTVVQGASSQITLTAVDTTQIVYTCTSVKSGTVLQNGSIDPTALSVTLPINEDVSCAFQGVSTAGDTVTAQVSVAVSCGNRIYDGGQCVDFACQSYVTLTSLQDLLSIPARSAAGVCYSYKLMSAIANSSSSLTTTIDTDVISRNHDQSSNPSVTHNPYSMGRFNGQFNLMGPRVVKLAGGASAAAHILVDNFVLIGVYPAASSLPADLNSAYKVYGTSDSSIADASGANTNSISFMNQLIPILAFATGGTSSVSPVDITAVSPANQTQTLDIRALDCGGSRQLSDIYLLFQ